MILRVCLLGAKQWLISVNTLKTEVILFTLKHFTNLPHIILDGIPIKFVLDHKHLGLNLSNKGRWHKHIEKSLAVLPKSLVLCVN